MPTPTQNYTSTGDKILHHPDAIADLQSARMRPLVLSIAPTERCQLKCTFCSVADRGENGQIYPDLPLYKIISVVHALIPRGLKAVIITGGGEPTLYKWISILIVLLKKYGLDIGLITNGININSSVSSLARLSLSWIRISANVLDYRENLPLPIISPDATLGLSYIVNHSTKDSTIHKLQDLVEVGIVENKQIKYIRMLPDCNLSPRDIELAHEYIEDLVAELGAPFFWQNKRPQPATCCYLPALHPFLYTSGKLFPCDSVVLNRAHGEKKFDDMYALCNWDEVGEFYGRPINGSLVNTEMCPNCVFTAQNELLKKIVDDEPLPTPIDGLNHVNFI